MGKPYLFCCPVTRHNVQGYSEQEPQEPDAAPRYETVKCLACAGTHLVNPATGHLLSDETKD